MLLLFCDLKLCESFVSTYIIHFIYFMSENESMKYFLLMNIKTNNCVSTLKIIANSFINFVLLPNINIMVTV